MFWIKNDQTKEFQKRRRHASCLIKDTIYTFGGDLKAKLNSGDDNISYYSNEIFGYSITKGEVFKVKKSSGQVPTGLFGFSMCVYKDSIICFGGITFPMVVSDVIYKFDTKENVWYQLSYRSNLFCYLFGHTAVAFEDKMIVYGGFHLGDANNKVIEYSFQESKMKDVRTTGKGPKYGSYCHSCVEYDGKMYLFGGKNDQHGRSNIMYSLDLKDGKYAWETIDAKGKIPSSRAGHSMTEKDGKIYIFGGFDGNTDLNDLYVFNINNSTWKEIYTTNCPPCSSFHSTIAFKHEGDVKLWNFGGLFGPDDNFEYYNDLNLITVESSVSDNIYTKRENYIDVLIIFEKN